MDGNIDKPPQITILSDVAQNEFRILCDHINQLAMLMWLRTSGRQDEDAEEEEGVSSGHVCRIVTIPDEEDDFELVFTKDGDVVCYTAN